MQTPGLQRGDICHRSPLHPSQLHVPTATTELHRVALNGVIGEGSKPQPLGLSRPQVQCSSACTQGLSTFSRSVVMSEDINLSRICLIGLKKNQKMLVAQQQLLCGLYRHTAPPGSLTQGRR